MTNFPVRFVLSSCSGYRVAEIWEGFGNSPAVDLSPAGRKQWLLVSQQHQYMAGVGPASRLVFKVVFPLSEQKCHQTYTVRSFSTLLQKDL